MPDFNLERQRELQRQFILTGVPPYQPQTLDLGDDQGFVPQQTGTLSRGNILSELPIETAVPASTSFAQQGFMLPQEQVLPERQQFLQPPPQQAPVDPYAQVPALPQYGEQPVYEQDPRAAMLQQLQLQQLEPDGTNVYSQAAQYAGAILGEDPIRDVGQVIQQRGQKATREEQLRQQAIGQQLDAQAQEAQKARDIQFSQEQQLVAQEYNQALAERNEIIRAIDQQYKRDQEYAELQQKSTHAEKKASLQLAQGGFQKMTDGWMKRFGKDPKKTRWTFDEIGEKAAKEGGQTLIDWQRDYSSLPGRANLTQLEELVAGDPEEAKLALLLYLNNGQNPKFLSRNARNIIKELK